LRYIDIGNALMYTDTIILYCLDYKHYMSETLKPRITPQERKAGKFICQALIDHSKPLSFFDLYDKGAQAKPPLNAGVLWQSMWNLLDSGTIIFTTDRRLTIPEA